MPGVNSADSGCASEKAEADARIRARVKSYLHIAPGYKVEKNEIKDIYGNLVCKVEAHNCEMDKATEYDLCYYASEFSDLKTGSCLVFTWNVDNDKHGYRIDFNVGWNRKS